MTNELDEKWYDNVTAAAIHLSLSNYYIGRSGSMHGVTHPSANTTAKLETPKSEFMQNRGGTIIVDICQANQYEVVVKTK